MGRKGRRQMLSSSVCRIPPSTVRSLHCIKPGFCLQAYFRTVRRGDAPGGRRGSGKCRQPCSTMQGSPPPTVPSCLGQTRSIFSQSHPRIESWPVAFLSLLLLSRPGISHVALQLRPQFIHRTIARKTCRCHAQHKIGHGRIGGWLCLAHTHTHTRVVYRCISYPKHAPPPLYTGIGHRPEHGAKEGREGGRGGETRLRACPSGSSRAPVPATATAPAPDHGTSSSALWTERLSTYPRDLVSSPRLASRRGRSAACILIAVLRPSPARADRQSGSQHWTDTSWSWPWPQRPPLSPGSATRVRTTTGWCWCWCWCR